MNTWTKIALAAGTALAFAAPAAAATQAATLSVNASVAGTCTIGASTLNFTAYTGALNDVTSTVSVNCTNATTYTVGMNNGNNFSTTRRMTAGGGNFLSYGIFQDAGKTTAWNNVSGQWVSGTGTGTAQSINIYGSMPAGQTAAVGTYNDAVTMTITY